MSHRNHPWHLVRCPSCRGFVISAAPKCPGCGAWRKSAQAVSLAGRVLAGILALAVVLFLSQALNQQERLRAHRLEEAALRAPLHR